MSPALSPSPSPGTWGGSGIALSPPLPTPGRKYNVRVEDIMVRDIRYVTLNCKYRDLQHVLHSTKLKSLPLVESAGEARVGGLRRHPPRPRGVPGWRGVGDGKGAVRSQHGPSLPPAESMILLGSIERAQVGALLCHQLSPQRRLQALRQKALAEDGHRLSAASIHFQVRGAAASGHARPGCPPQRCPQHPIPPQISTEASSGTPARTTPRKPLKPVLKRVPSSLAETPPGESAPGPPGPASTPPLTPPPHPQPAPPTTPASP